jgi:hypothetical protein
MLWQLVLTSSLDIELHNDFAMSLWVQQWKNRSI